MPLNMNWKQLYTLATPEERFELIRRMHHLIESRPVRRVLIRGRLIRERRGQIFAHFINDRRRVRKQAPYNRFYMALFIFIVATMTFAVMAVSYFAPPRIGVALIFSYDFLLICLMVFITRYKKIINTLVGVRSQF